MTTFFFDLGTHRCLTRGTATGHINSVSSLGPSLARFSFSSQIVLLICPGHQLSRHFVLQGIWPSCAQHSNPSPLLILVGSNSLGVHSLASPFLQYPKKKTVVSSIRVALSNGILFQPPSRLPLSNGGCRHWLEDSPSCSSGSNGQCLIPLYCFLDLRRGLRLPRWRRPPAHPPRLGLRQCRRL